MNAHESFKENCAQEIAAAGADQELAALTLRWMHLTAKYKYTYHFAALGRPVVQFPQDLIEIQELIWSVKPDLIVETGIAHGGSLIFSASALALVDYCEAVEAKQVLNPLVSRRHVLGVDIDIRPHNRMAIEAHPMSHRIQMIQGSSIAPDIVEQVYAQAKRHERVLVMLDSNHTHDHVLAELEAYAPLVTQGSYCVVFDTVVEWSPEGMHPNRPWKRGNSPLTAVDEYLRILASSQRVGLDQMPLQFDVDNTIDSKLLISTAKNGYLRRSTSGPPTI